MIQSRGSNGLSDKSIYNHHLRNRKKIIFLKNFKKNDHPCVYCQAGNFLNVGESHVEAHYICYIVSGDTL